MSRILCIFLWLTSAVLSFAQEGKQIVVGTRDTLYSKILGENRTLLVHLPMTEPDAFAPNQKYPVVYVLDGDGGLFYAVVAISEALSGGSGNFMYPKMIVVGVTNTDRTRDLTPTHSTDDTVMPAFLLSTSGGGQNFLSFFKDELIPYIESNYPAAPHRTIIGHSLGGLTVMHALANYQNLFQAHIAIDPSMWWDKQNFLKEIKAKLQKPSYTNQSLFVAIAHSMDKKWTVQTVSKDNTAATLPIRSILDLDQFIKSRKTTDLIYKSKYYPDYDHGGVAFVAVYDALPFVFNYYAIHFTFAEFFNPDYTNNDILVNHYKQVSQRMGYTVPPPGEFVNALAHQLMDMGQLDRAYSFLQLNMENYPQSYAPYEAMGAYYLRKEDKIKAKEYFTKALSLKDKLELREKLEKLK
jgi:uncharacterized protein